MAAGFQERDRQTDRQVSIPRSPDRSCKASKLRNYTVSLLLHFIGQESQNQPRIEGRGSIRTGTRCSCMFGISCNSWGWWITSKMASSLTHRGPWCFSRVSVPPFLSMTYLHMTDFSQQGGLRIAVLLSWSLGFPKDVLECPRTSFLSYYIIKANH